MSLIQVTGILFLERELLFTYVVLEERITKALKIFSPHTALKFWLGKWNEDIEPGIKLDFTQAS